MVYLIQMNKEISEKVHLRSDFRKKNISLSGARTHEKEQKNDESMWRFGDSNSAKQHLKANQL